MFQKKETVSADWVLDTLTLIPDVNSMKRFTQIEFTPHPVPITKDRWETIELPASDVYREEDRYYVLNQDMSCFPPIPNAPCDLCVLDHAFGRLASFCILRIYNETAKNPPCRS